MTRNKPYIRGKKNKAVVMGLDEEFYKKIEKERKKFEKKHNLRGLSTRAFSKVLANKATFKWD